MNMIVYITLAKCTSNISYMHQTLARIHENRIALYTGVILVSRILALDLKHGHFTLLKYTS